VHPERKGIYPDFPSFAPWAVMQHVIEGGRPVWGEQKDGPGPPPAYRRLAVQCWDADPAKRPTFEQIVSTLQAVTEEAEKYVESW
jgi:hypothetical protein